MEQNSLQNKINKSIEKWDSYDPLIKASYNALMENEAFWSYPDHLSFQKVPGWHTLGNA